MDSHALNGTRLTPKPPELVRSGTDAELSGYATIDGKTIEVTTVILQRGNRTFVLSLYAKPQDMPAADAALNEFLNNFNPQ